MLISFPYRVKNPPKKFPAVTLTIVVLNVMIFAVTSQSFHVIRREVVEQYALRWGESPLITVFTSMFLHADIFHLIWNMLFLWVFGPAVEDRLGAGLYVGLYLVAGFAGDAAQAALGAAGAIGVSVPLIGASGCIMGVLGAYWYMYAWSPVCIFYGIWIFWFWHGTFELAAVWVISIHFLLNLISGFLARSQGIVGGVASFAHVGGALAGAMIVWAFRLKRDSDKVSQVKAAQAEMRDMNMLTCSEMQTLVEGSPEDEELFVNYALKAMRDGGADDIKFALSRNLRTVITRCPQVAVYYLLEHREVPSLFSPGDLLYLGKWCESNGRPEQALSTYGLIETNHPDTPESEMALYRSAAVYWHSQHDSENALQKLDVLFSKFHHGTLVFEAEDLRDEMMKQSGEAQSKAA